MEGRLVAAGRQRWIRKGKAGQSLARSIRSSPGPLVVLQPLYTLTDRTGKTLYTT